MHKHGTCKYRKVGRMRKRDKNRERRELINAFAMLLQIGLAMMTCMAMSFGIGFYLDRLLGTKYWIMIFLLIGILASIRSLFILTGKFQSPVSSRKGTEGKAEQGLEHGSEVKGESDAGSKKDAR